MKIAVISGGFDPLHSGHISYIKAARQHGEYLIIALNSDKWLSRKKGQPFMNFEERREVLININGVDEVIPFEDDNLGSCINALEDIKINFPNSKIVFCKGGDRTAKNIPEIKVKDVAFEFSVGGDKKLNSSSKILKEWQFDCEKRVWGESCNIFQDSKLKLKELTVYPGKGMSLQKHFERDEIWFISKGSCVVNFNPTDPSKIKKYELKEHDSFSIRKQEWHQIYNPYQEECKIIEIQYGNETSEDDIERYSLFQDDLK